MENLEKGSREWQPVVGNRTRVDFLMLNQTFRYSMSELINAVKALDKKKDAEKYNVHVGLQTQVSLKKTCIEDYLFYEVLNF